MSREKKIYNNRKYGIFLWIVIILEKIVIVFNIMYFLKFLKFNIVINFNGDIVLFSKICYIV